MMPGFITEALAMEQAASEPWVPEAVLYKPLPEQITLADSAVCQAVELYLRMCGLPHDVQERSNAKDMTLNGALPLIKCGSFFVAGFDPIVDFISKKGNLLSEMSPADKTDMEVYISMVRSDLGTAEEYVTWLEPVIYQQYTVPRFKSVHPWPLGEVLVWLERRHALQRLAAFKWRHKSLDDVYDAVDHCCGALSERLGDGDCFLGSDPCALDALLYGHLYTILNTPLSDPRLQLTVKQYSNLVQLVSRLEARFYSSRPDTV